MTVAAEELYVVAVKPEELHVVAVKHTTVKAGANILSY